MIVLRLSISEPGSWEGIWRGDEPIYVITRREQRVREDLWGKTFSYTAKDGCIFYVSVFQTTVKVARMIERESTGLHGYDWMIDSLLKDGYIHSARS